MTVIAYEFNAAVLWKHKSVLHRLNVAILYNIIRIHYKDRRLPGSLVVRIPRSHRGGRGSIPRLGIIFCCCLKHFEAKVVLVVTIKSLLWKINKKYIIIYILQNGKLLIHVFVFISIYCYSLYVHILKTIT